MKIPAVVFSIVAILALSIVLLLLLPRLFSTHRTLEMRFQESLIEVRSNHGDVLEVATCKSTASFTEEDQLDTTVLGITVPLGKTESFLMVPVTYRFHVLLSDSWRIRSTRETVLVTAPAVRPSLPPAPDISAMQVRTARGWARFNGQEVEERVKDRVTGALNIRAYKLAGSPPIRDAARHSIEEAIKRYIPWLPEESRGKVFQVRFADEEGGAPCDKTAIPSSEIRR